MPLFFQTIFLGILVGGTYSLIAVGLSLISGVFRIVNFAHGAVFMIGGFACYYLSTVLGAPQIVGVLGAIIAGAIISSLLYVVFLRPVHTGQIVDRPEEYSLIVTFAVSLLITALAVGFFGGEFRQVHGMWSGNLALGDWMRTSGNRVVAFGGAVLLIAILFWVVYRTDLGRGWRALAQNKVGASVVGVSVPALAVAAFAVAGGLAGAAGALLAPLFFVYPAIGQLALIKGFAVMVIGGLGSVVGSLVAGVLLGVIEVLFSTYFDAAYRDAYGFMLMVVVLLTWPQGLFGRKGRTI